ncbi:P-loop containing nucleoside triphosphate hydrolase protein [Dactylonectria macrodidyma]|uniref:P-loop containing nucleoside triphosphate hydrolase protein n=1 Tax=Dactylonectria macrodidyma TaxID=307937 RepID=A0A9P9E228_9HYPO|nr:P-loop containing nucleoside triphosphate hydrolase protein [Dactylonectria macrodidyma]
MTVHSSRHSADMFLNLPPSSRNPRANPVPSSSDVFIALMGMTGAGKSTFISHCTDEKVLISEPGALESCTQEVQVHICKHFNPHANVYLVDTPGFDDTNRKDADILKEIASWLTKSYQEKIQLRGLLYLHRISDNRMGGCARKNLFMFKRLCGRDGMKNIRFVTTFWEQADPKEGERREQTLRDTKDFWGGCMSEGAQVNQHYNNKQSALSILQQFVPGWTDRPSPEEVKLAIQTEMVDSGKDLDQTGAGRELQDQIDQEREKMRQEMREREEDMKEALAARDKEMFDFLRSEQDKQRAELRRRDREMDELKVSMEKMHEDKIRRLEARLQQQEQEYRDELDRVRVEGAEERSRYGRLMDGLKRQVDSLTLQSPRSRNPQPASPGWSYRQSGVQQQQQQQQPYLPNQEEQQWYLPKEEQQYLFVTPESNPPPPVLVSPEQPTQESDLERRQRKHRTCRKCGKVSREQTRVVKPRVPGAQNWVIEKRYSG